MRCEKKARKPRILFGEYTFVIRSRSRILIMLVTFRELPFNLGRTRFTCFGRSSVDAILLHNERQW